MIDRYLTGNRVYRHGSSAPTMGTVDPMGYIDRELRKRRMLGQESDTRSGLAQTALQRLRQPTRTPVTSSGTAALQAKLAAVRAQHLAEVQQQQATLRAKQMARPRVSPVGKVSPTRRPAAKPTALPWDMDAMTQKINAGNEYEQLKNQILAQRQSAQRDYSQGVHELDAQQPEAERGLLNNFAGRGLAFGSGYGMGVGQLQNQFAGKRAGLQGQLTDLMNTYTNQESAGGAKYNQMLAAIQQALAQKLAGRAGTLGFGPVR